MRRSTLRRQIASLSLAMTTGRIARLGASLTSLLLAMTLIVAVTKPSNAQSRSAGKLVVPKGYENFDSIRFSLFGIEDGRLEICNGRYDDRDLRGNPLMRAYADSLSATFEGRFGGVGVPPDGKRKGIYDGRDSLVDLIRRYKSRTFYPSPGGAIGFNDIPGYYWRYNDVNFDTACHWHNNSYDTNDISPYCEYPANHAHVIDTFTTSKYGSPALVYYGDEGRVILGYSDNRAADQLLRVAPDTLFTGGDTETAKTFSVTLDFNIDESSIDNTLASGRPDSLLPLMTLQVLFKEGADSSNFNVGKPILPFVPFADAGHPGNPGWYKVAEVVVTKHVYDSLINSGNYSWKAEDTLQSGDTSHGWRFVQLHAMLTDIPQAMRDLVKANIADSQFYHWGQGSGAGPISLYSNPDEIEARDTLIGTDPAKQPLLELRVLSTYRATVRIRGLDYHDTIVDKFLYRKRIAGTLDSTHSCNPDGSIGGYDDSVRALFARYSAPTPQEIMMNDAWYSESGYVGSLSVPMLGYFDFMGSHYNLYSHWREQDAGNDARHYRRFRMIFDGQPPSIFENQYTFFGGDKKVFPQEYVYYDTTLDPPSTAWPSSNDSIIGFVTGRKTTSDSLKSYNAYSSGVSQFSDFCGKLRATSRIALWHPNKKRFAVEAELQDWALGAFSFTADPVTHVFHFDRKIGYHDAYRPVTPEETMAMAFCALAEGVPGFNSAQGIDLSSLNGGFGSGLLGVAPVHPDSVNGYPLDSLHNIYLTHGYNIGHAYTFNFYNPTYDTAHALGQWWRVWTIPQYSDVCGDLPAVYLGYSNNWRAHIRLMDRLNAIYDSTNGRKCPHPYKYLTWQDAYSNSRTVNDHYGFGDSVTKSNAFLKIVQTQKVNPWQRNSDGTYIDSIGKIDPPEKSFVEVGLFKDSISKDLINRAVIVVNTHLYPSLRDAEDLNYYNQGLDSISMCHPVYGDIDVRKIYMTIDTNQLDASFRSSYYVVRDLWHPDTTWLVKADSNFAIYLKPGDAKFLYFEKAIAITAAPTAYMGYQYDMGLNNGHQIAERMRGTRQVVVHTRARKLYVDLPAKGYTFPGPFEHSSADNLATGPEIAPDLDGDGNHILGVFDTLYTLNPVVAPAQNDTAVAIAYYVTDTVGRIKIAYQPHPDSAWKFLTFRSAEFTQSAHPVLAPLSKTQWLVAASWVRSSTSDSNKIVGFRFTANPGQPLQLDDATPLTLVVEPGTDSLQTPSLASRPNFGWGFPARLAWMYKKQIYYRQISFPKNKLLMTPIEWVSKGLVDCANEDPQIVSTNLLSQFIDFATGFGWVGYGESDLVAWDAVGYSNSRTYINDVWPVLRVRDNYSGNWSPFELFRPADKMALHYPQIAAEGSEEWIFLKNHLPKDTIYLFDSDVYRIMLNNEGGQVEVVSLAKNTWTKSQIPESGHNPSSPVRTDSLLSDPGLRYGVLNPMSFEGEYIGDVRPVRVTNANLPDIRTKLTAAINFFITAPPLPDSASCPKIKSRLRGSFGAPTAVGASGVLPLLWYPPRPSDSTENYLNWPNDPPRAELHSYAFPYAAHDTLIIARSLMIDDSASIFAAMHHTGDFVKYRLVLLRSADSSYVLTLDSMIFERDTVIPTMSWRDTLIAPGYVKDSMWLGYRIPNGTSSDTGMLAIELSHSSGLDSLYRTVVVYLSDSVDARGAEKKGNKQEAVQPSALKLSIHPNPFNPVTQIDIYGSSGHPIRVELLDVLGRLVQPLYDAESPAGTLHLVLEGQQLSSGTYFVRATSGTEVVTRRVQLIK